MTTRLIAYHLGAFELSSQSIAGILSGSRYRFSGRGSLLNETTHNNLPNSQITVQDFKRPPITRHNLHSDRLSLFVFLRKSFVVMYFCITPWH